MAETSYPSPAYNSGALTETEYELLATDGYMPSGLVGVPTDSQLCYGDSSGRQVKFRAGIGALVRGQRWSVDADLTKSISANAGATRFDLATLRLDRTTQLVTAHIITGTSGSGVPSPVQNAPGSGVWDLPVASIRVATGATSIAATDVTNLAWYLGEPTYTCLSTARPPHRYGRVIRDELGWWWSTGSAWQLLNQADSGFVTLPAASGWSGDESYIRKINGVTYVDVFVERTGGALSPGTTTNLATLPVGYRPTTTTRWSGWAQNVACAGAVFVTTGVIQMTAYNTTIHTGDQVIATIPLL